MLFCGKPAVRNDTGERGNVGIISKITKTYVLCSRAALDLFKPLFRSPVGGESASIDLAEILQIENGGLRSQLACKRCCVSSKIQDRNW